jgi:hypothetical protein
MSGIRYDAGKAPLWILPWGVLAEYVSTDVSRAKQAHYLWAFGRGAALPPPTEQELSEAAQVMAWAAAEKYPLDNWTEGLSYLGTVSAGLRHAIASGEDNESGLSHDWHLSCNFVFCWYFQSNPTRYGQFDDRPKVIVCT